MAERIVLVLVVGAAFFALILSGSILYTLGILALWVIGSIWWFGNVNAVLGEGGSVVDRRSLAASKVKFGEQRRVLYGNPFAQVGELVDFWSDLVEGEAAKKDEFKLAYWQIIQGRKIAGLRVNTQTLTSSGLLAYSREFEMVRQGIVTGAVYIHSLGDDLYISWRIFAQRQISLIRLLAWQVVCVLLAIRLGTEDVCSLVGCESFFEFRSFIGGYIIILAATSIGIGLWGFFLQRGDLLGLLREPFYELQIDDIESLAHVVHKSVMAAADSVGIDPELLAPREISPTGSRGQGRRKPRI